MDPGRTSQPVVGPFLPIEGLADGGHELVVRCGSEGCRGRVERVGVGERRGGRGAAQEGSEGQDGRAKQADLASRCNVSTRSKL